MSLDDLVATGEDRQVVVVGAGYPGIVCAAVLARAGLRPLVLAEVDLAGQPGGAYPYGDYWIDFAHRDAPGVCDNFMAGFTAGGEAARRAGAEVHKVAISPAMRIHLRQDREGFEYRTTFSGGLRSLAETSLGVAPDKVEAFVDVWKSLASKTPEEARALRHVTFADWLPSLGDEAMSRAMLGLATIMYSRPPESTSVGQFIVNVMHNPMESYSSNDPEVGGMQGFMQPFIRVIEECGGTIWPNVRPLKVMVDAGTVTGVRVHTANSFVREVRSPNVVFTLPAYKILDLVDGDPFDEGFRSRAEVTRPFESRVVTAYLGLSDVPHRAEDGQPETYAGWNRILVGPEREYLGGWFLPSLTSRSAPPGKHLLEACYGGSPEESDYDTLRRGVSEVIRYANHYYRDLGSLLEWSEIQLRDKPSAITWLFSTAERVPVRSEIGGLYFASSTSEAPGYDQEMEANAALEACDHILSGQ